MNKFALRVKELREEKKISQLEMSLDLDFSQSAVAKWENGTREPSIDVIIMLCKYFNVSSDYLIGLTD